MNSHSIMSLQRMDGDLADYEIEIRIRNARILGLMRRAGIANANQLAKKSGVTAQSVGLLLNLKVSPLESRSPRYRQQIYKIADALGVDPDDMFSNRQRSTYLATNRKAIEVSEAEVEGQLAALEHMAPDEMIQVSEQKMLVSKALRSLTPREERVLKLRFGIDGPELTLDEAADQIGISRERVRQIENKAIRTLRHPTRSKDLAHLI